MDNEKVEAFRLVAEMNNGNVYSVKLDSEQRKFLNSSIGEMLAGKLTIHRNPFGCISDMCPSDKLDELNGESSE